VLHFCFTNQDEKERKEKEKEKKQLPSWWTDRQVGQWLPVQASGYYAYKKLI
jgi:hypothetical protein